MLKRIAGWLVLVLVLGGLCLFIFASKPERVQSFRKTDGTLMTLVSVNFATNQTFVHGGLFQRMLYSVLPKRWKNRAKVTVFKRSSFRVNPTFWFDEEKGGAVWEDVRAVDEFGCEYQAGGYSKTTQPVKQFGQVRNNERVEYVSCYEVLGGYPNGKIIGLRFYDSRAGTNPVGTVLVPGMDSKKLQQSKIHPVIARDGDISFELTEFATGLTSMPYDWDFKITNADLFTQAVFHISEKTARRDHWSVRCTEAKDSHGNLAPIWNRKQCQCTKDGDSVFNLQGMLEPASGPWQLTILFENKSDRRIVQFEAMPVDVRKTGFSKN